MKTALIVLVALFAMAAAQGPNGVKVVDNAEPQPNIAPNFDSAFYQPSNPNGGYEPISKGPALVDFNRPGKQFNDPKLRGGK